MKKYVFTFILMFLFITNVRALNYVGHYECYNGGTLLNKSTFDVEMGSDLYWKCNQGFTNVNFYFTYYGGGTGPGGEGENATFSFVPSSPLGVDSGFDLYNTNNKCLVTANQIICPATTNSSGDFGFALFSNDKNSYWHILKKFYPASDEEKSALTTFQAQQSLQNNTNNAINNSTNSINSNSNNNKNEIINNQNAQFNELKEKQDEANETSKGIWGTIKEIFQSIVSLPGKIFEFIKGIFIPEPKCHTSKNLFNKDSGFQLGYIDSNNKFMSANNNALFDYIKVKPNTTYTLSFKGSITGATSVLFYEDKSLIRRDSSRKTFNFITTEDTKYIRLFFNYDGVTTMTQEVIDSLEIMLTEGETIEPYEPFGEICEETSFFTWFQRLGDIIGGFFTNLFSFLGDDDTSKTDISGLGNVTGIFPTGPLDSLLNIPFQFLSIVVSSFSGTCTPITGNFVFNQPFTIPCFSDNFYNRIPDGLMTFIQLIPSSFLLIKYFKHLYKKVDRAMSLETNSDDEWGAI